MARTFTRHTYKTRVDLQLPEEDWQMTQGGAPRPHSQGYYLFTVVTALALMNVGPLLVSWPPNKDQREKFFAILFVALIALAGWRWRAPLVQMRRIQFWVPIYCVGILGWAEVTDLLGWPDAGVSYGVRVGGFAVIAVAFFVTVLRRVPSQGASRPAPRGPPTA